MTRLAQRKEVAFAEVFSPNWINAIEIITNRLPVEKTLLNDDEESALLYLDNKWNLDSVRENIEYSDRGGHAKEIQLVQKLEDRVYVTASRRPVPLLR